MSSFDSLALALEDWFDTPLADLPDALRKRVVQEFFPMPWDNLSADQRRSVALQLDYQHDPPWKGPPGLVGLLSAHGCRQGPDCRMECGGHTYRR
jgi:hypothetical protein